MAGLTPVEQVRLGIGDTIIPFILSDAQIKHYLDANSDDISSTITELQPIIIAYFASTGNTTRVGDIWEDTANRAKNYAKAIEKANQIKASSVYPIVGGASEGPEVWVDMFDDENEDSGSTSAFYNSVDDL